MSSITRKLLSTAGWRSVVTDNIVLRLEAASNSSYPDSGTNWFDLSPEGNDGILTNGPVFNNTYFDFDGDNDFVELGTITTSNALQLSSPAGGGLTVMFATYWDGSGDNYQRVIDKSSGGNALYGWAVFPDLTSVPANHMVFLYNVGPTAADRVNITSGVTIGTAVWEIWAFTFDQSTGAWVWYKDGVPVNSGTTTYAVPSVQTNARIATWNHSTGREWNGRIGFMYVYEKPLSATEVVKNYNAWKDLY